MFGIEIIPASPSEEGAEDRQEALGRITLGEFSETFRSSLSYWSQDDYRRSWRRALEVLGTGESATSCLVTSITDPSTANFVFCWPLYRSGEIVHVQNSIVFLGELENPFDPAEPWRSVGPRETTDEDGNRISEWNVTFDSMKEWAERSASSA